MSTLMTGISVMGRPRKLAKTSPVRLTEEAQKWAKIASGYTGESMADYVSRIVAERGKEDADRLHGEMMKEAKPRRPRPSD